MKRGIVLAAAALGSFALTMTYLQKQRDAAPAGNSRAITGQTENGTARFTDAADPRRTSLHAGADSQNRAKAIHPRSQAQTQENLRHSATRLRELARLQTAINSR